MALEATHLRLALDLKDYLGIEQDNGYIAGAIYPDSRYVTGADRAVTHRITTALQEPLSNFKKGWLTHLYCDLVQKEIHLRDFADLIPDGTPQEQWVGFTAMKIVQDIQDAAQVPFKDIASAFEYTETPSSEAIEKVNEFNIFIRDLYGTKEKIKIEDYQKLWKVFGVSNDFGKRIISTAKDFLNNKTVATQLSHVYLETKELVAKMFSLEK